MRTSGRYPWCVDPELGITFFRPLSAATHQLDYWLWPGSAWLMHAHSLVWHAGVCAMGWAVARRLVTQPRVAGLAGLVYALSFTHVVPWSWLAHRNGLVSTFFADLPWAYPLAVLGMAILTSFLFAQFGLLAAIYANSFDSLSMFTNFLILPLIYLGGVFYPISLLPKPWSELSHLNPIFYLIDGFRHALIGVGDLPLWLSFTVGGVMSIVAFFWAAVLIGRGYRLRN